MRRAAHEDRTLASRFGLRRRLIRHGCFNRPARMIEVVERIQMQVRQHWCAYMNSGAAVPQRAGSTAGTIECTGDCVHWTLVVQNALILSGCGFRLQHRRRRSDPVFDRRASQWSLLAVGFGIQTRRTGLARYVLAFRSSASSPIARRRDQIRYCSNALYLFAPHFGHDAGSPDPRRCGCVHTGY